MVFLISLVIGLLLLIPVVEFAIPTFLIWLGKQDSKFSPVRTLPPPGEMYIVVRGNPDGPYDTIIESVTDWGFNEELHVFEPEPGKKTDDTYLGRLGLKWVGFWKYLLWRKVKYDKWEKLPDSQDSGVVSKERGDRNKKNDPKDPHTPSIFFQYNMATTIDAAETQGNFPIDAVMVFTVQIVDPVKAFFFAGGWESQVTSAVQGKFREYVGLKSIEDLRKEVASTTTGSTKGDLAKQIEMLGNGPHGLFELFGVIIIDARFVKFDLVSEDGDEEMIAASRAKEIAIMNAEAARETAKGEADAQRERAQGERDSRIFVAEGIEAEYKARSSVPDGAAFSMAEAIKEARPSVLNVPPMIAVETPPRTEPRKK